MNKVQDQPAYILHQRPYRDTSQIIELFSRDYGRFSVVSRGSRSARSRTRSILQPFRPLHVSWSGKGEMPSLTGAEPASRKIPQLRGDQLASGFYINELLMRLLHRFDVQDDIYALYEQTLYQLAAGQSLQHTLRYFEKHLLELLGFALNLSVDADSGEAVEADVEYQYQIEHGPVRLNPLPDTAATLVVSGASLLALDQDALQSEQALKDAKRLMRQVLAFYLDGKPLKSRELFR